MNFLLWEFHEIKNEDLEFEVFLEVTDEPPPLEECTELGEEGVDSECLDREGEMLETHDASNTVHKADAESVRIEASYALHLQFSI